MVQNFESFKRKAHTFDKKSTADLIERMCINSPASVCQSQGLYTVWKFKKGEV